MLADQGHEHIAWTSGIFAILGVIIGALLTHLLARRSQSKQWMAENRKAEFRELLTGINGSFTTILALTSHRPFFADDSLQRDILLAETKGASVIADRIFIAEEVSKLKLMDRWTTATRAFATDKDILKLGRQVNGLSDDIRKCALKSIQTL